MNKEIMDLSIVDVYTHTGYCANFYMPDVSLEGMINTTDKIKYQKNLL